METCVECKASFEQDGGEWRIDGVTEETGFVCFECISTTPMPDPMPIRNSKQYRSFNLESRRE